MKDRTGEFVAYAAALALIAGSFVALGMLRPRTERGPNASGFDFNVVPGRAASADGAGLTRPSLASSLSMVRAEAGLRFSAAAAPSRASADPAEQARNDFTAAARRYERTVWNFGRAQTKAHPVLYRYGREWMSYPDLKKLNDDYFVDHDPVKFLMGVSRSPNFPKLVGKYAHEPDLQNYVIEGVKKAPADLAAAAMKVLEHDNVAQMFVLGVAKSMGLPEPMLAMIPDAKASPVKLDEKKLSEALDAQALRRSADKPR